MLGSSPKQGSQPQNFFVFVASWTWISSPITASSSATGLAPRRRLEPDCLLERVGSLEQCLLAEGRRCDLETDRQLRRRAPRVRRGPRGGGERGHPAGA